MGHRSAGNDSEAMEWSWPLTLVVAGAGLVVLVVGLVLIFAVSRSAVSGVLACIGGVVVFVAFQGRLATSIKERYGYRPLAQYRRGVSGTRRRGVVRRSSGVAYVFAALGLLLAVVGNQAGAPADVAFVMAGCGIAMVLGCFLGGPAARFVVTGPHLDVVTTMRRFRVPRRLIGEFERSGLEVRLTLTNGDYLDFRVDSPMLDLPNGSQYRTNAHCQVRTVERLVRMLTAVEETPTTETAVVITRRPVMVGVAATAALIGVAALAGTAMLLAGGGS
jgi:hypothetical protein